MPYEALSGPLNNNQTGEQTAHAISDYAQCASLISLQMGSANWNIDIGGVNI
jgi:hypothetical protein